MLVLIALLATQVTSGLFASDGLFAYGPLSGFISESSSEQLTLLHELGFWLLACLVLIHISTIILYRLIHGENLVLAMLTGRKPALRYVDEPQAVLKPLWLLLLCLGIATLLALWVISGFEWSQLTDSF